jgi:predicted ArsR family transcriptional regulator
MEGSILALLEQHESLGFEQIVAQLAEPPDAVRSALTGLRYSGFVSVLSIGETEGHAKGVASYWLLTDRGREQLARLRLRP